MSVLSAITRVPTIHPGIVCIEIAAHGYDRIRYKGECGLPGGDEYPREIPISNRDSKKTVKDLAIKI